MTTPESESAWQATTQANTPLSEVSVDDVNARVDKGDLEFLRDRDQVHLVSLAFAHPSSHSVAPLLLLHRLLASSTLSVLLAVCSKGSMKHPPHSCQPTSTAIPRLACTELDTPLLLLVGFACRYQTGTDLYERRPDKKHRAPAWCDRVLWRSNTGNDSHIQCRVYDRAELVTQSIRSAKCRSHFPHERFVPCYLGCTPNTESV